MIEAEQFRTDMPEHEIQTVPEAWLKGVRQGTLFLGDCVNRAKSYFLEHLEFEGIAVVIGVCRFQTLDYGHAWVEIGSVVFDGMRQRFFDRDGYCKATRAVTVRRLLADDGLAFLVNLRGHVWEELLAPLREKHGNSLVIDNESGAVSFRA